MTNEGATGTPGQRARAAFTEALAKSPVPEEAPGQTVQMDAAPSEEAPAETSEAKLLPTEFDDLMKVDPEGLSPAQLKELQRNLNKGFTQNRQKDAERVRALEAQLEEMKASAGGHAWVRALEERFGADPDFADKFKSLWSGDQQTKATTPRRSDRLTAYLDRMETPEDRESTKQLYDVIRHDIADEVADRLAQKDHRIAALEAQLKDGTARVSALSEDQRRRADQEAAQQFRSDHPEFDKLSNTQKEAFVALLRHRSSTAPQTDAGDLFKEWYSDLEGIGKSKVNETLSSLKDRAGKVPPPPAGQAGVSQPEFRQKGAKLAREIFDFHRSKVQGL